MLWGRWESGLVAPGLVSHHRTSGQGNVVLWKPSDTAMLASYAVYRVLREAGLPPNIIQFVPADGPTFGDTVTSSEHLCGINFTGSVP